MVEAIYKYETIFVVDVDRSEEEINAVVDKFKDLIAANGTVEGVDVWGKRKLAYPINFKTEGYYVLINFSAKPEFPKELDRNYRITDSIMRSIIVRRDEVTAE